VLKRKAVRGFPNLLSIKVIFGENFTKASKWLVRGIYPLKRIIHTPKNAPAKGDQTGANSLLEGSTFREENVG